MEKSYLIVLLTIGLPAFVLGQDLRAEYGQRCSDVTQPIAHCKSDDILDPLRCTATGNDVGVCACEVDMFRHRTLNRCVGSNGVNCTVRAGDGLPMRTCTEFAQCWPEPTEGTPRQHGTCACDLDAVHDPVSGECKLNYGSTRCQLETDCNVLNHIVCHENQCVCQDEENRRYDATSQKCLSLVGGTCTDNNECLSGQHIVCNTTENANQCICEPGFSPTPDKTCGKMLGAECNVQADDCHDDFVCDATQTPPKCNCPADQVAEGASCKILAGKNCTNTELTCVEHSTCENEVCTCSTGYTNGPGDKCFGLFDTPCNNITATDQPCSEAHFLVCSSDSKCTCKDNYDYGGDEDNKRCVGRLGAECGESNDDCSGNLVCTAQVCSCPDRFVDGGNGNCVGVHGAGCSSAGECSTAHYLTCNSATSLCDCNDPSTQLHEAGSNRCLWKANNVCTDNCVTNSTCSTANPRTCVCNANHVATEEGTCVAGNGASAVVASSMLVAIAMIIIGKDH